MDEKEPQERGSFLCMHIVHIYLQNFEILHSLKCVLEEHTSENAKSQNFLGACPQTPSHYRYFGAPLFVFAPPPHPLGGPVCMPLVRGGGHFKRLSPFSCSYHSIKKSL